MDVVFGILGPLVMVAVLAELFMYSTACERLAWTAWLRVGPPERIPLTREQLEALTSVERDTGYREAPAQTLDLSRLELIEQESEDAVLRPCLARGFVAVRLRWRFFAFNRMLAVGRVDVRRVADGLETQSRYAPTPMVSVAAIAPLFALPSIAHQSTWSDALLASLFSFGGTALYLGVFLGIVTLFVRGRMRRATAWANECIAEAVAELR